MTPSAFVLKVASLTKDGEDLDGQPFDLTNDHAVDTLHSLISLARTIEGPDLFVPTHRTTRSLIFSSAAGRVVTFLGGTPVHLNDCPGQYQLFTADGATCWIGRSDLAEYVEPLPA